jgi:hypothetical protein
MGQFDVFEEFVFMEAGRTSTERQKKSPGPGMMRIARTTGEAGGSSVDSFEPDRASPQQPKRCNRAS